MCTCVCLCALFIQASACTYGMCKTFGVCMSVICARICVHAQRDVCGEPRGPL